MNDTDKKNNEQKIISSLVRDFIIYIDQECFKSPEDFNPFVDLVVPTLRKYNQKLNVNCDYIKHVRKVLANEKNLKNNLDILQRSGRLSIVDCASVGDLISSHHSDGNTLFITQDYDQATGIKNNEDTFDSNNLFIKCINLEASLDYFKGIRNKYASLGNSPAEAAKMNSIIIDMSSLFFENTSFFLDDLNLFNNPSFKYKFYICKTDLDKFYNEAKISHFADSSYSRLDREFGAITFNPQLEGRDDSATVRKFRTEKNVGVLTFNDSRASEFYNMNDPDLSGRWVCPFKIKDGDANTDYPSSPWKNDINNLFAKVKDFLNSNEDSFAKYAELSKARTAASIEEDEKKKQIESAKAKPAEEKKPVADPIIKVNNSDFSDLVVESDATKNNEMMFAKSKDFAKAVVQPKSQDVVAPLATSSVKASTINPEVASTDDSVIRQVNQNNNLQFVKSDEKKPSIADRVQPPVQAEKKIETPVSQEKKAEHVKTTVSVVGAAKSVADAVSVEKIVPQEGTKVESFDSVFSDSKPEQVVKSEEISPEKPEVKAEVKTDIKVESKPEVKTEAKVEAKSEEKIAEKVEVKPEEKIVEKVEVNPEEKVEVLPEEKIVEKAEVKPEEKIVEKVEVKPEEKIVEKAEVKPEEKTVEKVAAKPVEKEEKKHRGFFGFSLFGRKKNKAEEEKTAEVKAEADEVKTAVAEKTEAVKADVAEKIADAQAKVDEAKTAVTEKAEAVKADVAEKIADAKAKVDEVKTAVADKAAEAKTAVTEKVEAVKAETAEKLADTKVKVDEVKTAVADKAAEAKTAVTEKVEAVKAETAEKIADAKAKVDEVKTAVADKAAEAKTAVTEKVEAVKTETAEKIADAKAKVDEVKTAVADKAAEAKTAVAEKAEAVKAETAEKLADAKAKVDEAKTAVADKAAEAKTAVTEKVEAVKAETAEKIADARAKVDEVKTAVADKAADAKTAVTEKVEAVKADTAEKIADAKAKVDEVKTAVADKAADAKTAVTEKVEAVKADTAENLADAKAKVDEVKTAVADKAAEVKTAIAEKAGEVKAALTEKTDESKTEAVEKAEELKSVDPVIGVADGASESVEDAIKSQKSIKESIAGIVGDTDVLNDNDEHNKKVKFMSSGLGFNFTKKPETKKDSSAEHGSSDHEAKTVKFVSSGSNYKFSFKKKHDDSAAPEEHADAHSDEHAKHSFVSSGSNFMFTVKKKTEETEEKKVEAAPAKAEEKKTEAAPAKAEEKKTEAAPVKTEDKKADTISSDDKKLLNLSHETTRIALDSGTAVSSDVPAKPSLQKSNFDSNGASVSLADAVKIHDSAKVSQSVKTQDNGITASDVLKNVSVDDKMNIVNDFNRFRVSDIADSIIDSSNRAEKADGDISSTEESITAGSSTSYKDAVSALAKKTKAENSVMVGSASSMAERTEEIKKSFAKTVELASEKVKSEAESAGRSADVTSIDSGRNDAQDLIKKLNPVKTSREEYAAKGKSIVNEMLSSIDQVKSNTSFGESDAIRDEDKTPAALQLKPSAAGFNLTGKELEKIQKEREAEEKARLAQEAKQREEDIALGKIKVPHVTQNFKLDKTTGGFNITSDKAEELQERHRINNIGLVEALKAEKTRQEKEAADYARDVNTVKAIEEFELEGENADYVYGKSSKIKDETPVEDFDMNEKRKEMLRNYEASQRSEVSVRRNLDSASFYNANDKRKSRYGNAVNSAGQTARKVADVRGFDSSLFSDKPKSSSMQKTNPERSTQDYARVNQMIEERTRELENRKPEAALQQTQTRTDATSTQSQTVDIVISSQDGVKAGAGKEVAAVRTEASRVEESIDVKPVSVDRSVVSSMDNSAQAPFARTGNPYQVTVGLGIVEIPKLNDSVFINGAEVKLTNPIIMSQSLAIYANEKDPDTIIKIFGRNSLNASMIAKLETMMENQVNIEGIEWPRALIKNASGDIVGCVMRKINTTSLQVMCNSREYYFHSYNRIDLVRMALDYLNKVAKLHELNIFLGVEDLNAIAIDAHKKVSFLNLERMQIGDYPYLPVLNAVTAPELSSELSANMAGEISDRYVVAYTLFKLLFLGRSPYVTSHLQGVPVDKLTAFRFPENVFDPMVPPKDEAFYIWSYLPQYIKEAFISSLSTGYHESDRRKTVNDWLVLMNKFLVEITNPAVAPMALELSPSRAASADSSTSVECKLCRSAVSKIDASVTDGFCHHCFNQRGRLAKCSCCGKTFLVSYRDIKVGGDDSPKFCQSCKTKFMHTKTISKCHECNRSYVVTEGDELLYGSEIYSRCQDCLKAERDKKKEAEAKADGMITKK